MLNNEKIVKLGKNGILTYYNFDTPGTVKDQIDLTSHDVTNIRFQYAGRPQAQPKSAAESPPDKSKRHRPKPNVLDEFRVYLQNRNTFIFRASKLTSFPMLDEGKDNPCVERWEKAIRTFSNKVTTIFLY